MMQISTPNAAYKIGSLVKKGYVDKILNQKDPLHVEEVEFPEDAEQNAEEALSLIHISMGKGAAACAPAQSAPHPGLWLSACRGVHLSLIHIFRL